MRRQSNSTATLDRATPVAFGDVIEEMSSQSAQRVGMLFLRVTASTYASAYGSHETLYAEHAVRNHFVQKTPAVSIRASLVYVRAYTRSARHGDLPASSPSIPCRLYRLTYGRLTTGT